MADRVSRRGKRKTVQFWGMFVWIIVFYFYNICLTIYAFYNKRLQTLFKDPLDQTKATCSFKVDIQLIYKCRPKFIWCKLYKLQYVYILYNYCFPLWLPCLSSGLSQLVNYWQIFWLAYLKTASGHEHIIQFTNDLIRGLHLFSFGVLQYIAILSNKIVFVCAHNMHKCILYESR